MLMEIIKDATVSESHSKIYIYISTGFHFESVRVQRAVLFSSLSLLSTLYAKEEHRDMGGLKLFKIKKQKHKKKT